MKAICITNILSISLLVVLTGCATDQTYDFSEIDQSSPCAKLAKDDAKREFEKLNKKRTEKYQNRYDECIKEAGANMDLQTKCFTSTSYLLQTPVHQEYKFLYAIALADRGCSQ